MEPTHLHLHLESESRSAPQGWVWVSPSAWPSAWPLRSASVSSWLRLLARMAARRHHRTQSRHSWPLRLALPREFAHLAWWPLATWPSR